MSEEILENKDEDIFEVPEKYQVVIDENRYWTGVYASAGGLEDGVEADSIPEESDRLKKRCWKLSEENTWWFDEEKYNTLISEQNFQKLAVLKLQRIAQSKSNLENHLGKLKLKSSCHGGEEKSYSVTAEKQQYLANMIMTALLAEQGGAGFVPLWNASGEVCEEWTLAELQQLTMEMEQLIRPLIYRQQQMEVEIQAAASLEEAEAVSISFEAVSDTDGEKTEEIKEEDIP